MSGSAEKTQKGNRSLDEQVKQGSENAKQEAKRMYQSYKSAPITVLKKLSEA